MIMKFIPAIFLASLVAGSASAHEIWLERDGSTLKVYAGDKTGEVDTGDNISKLVSTSRLFGRDLNKISPVTAQSDHLVGNVGTNGDVRFYNDQVWAPWEADGKFEAAAFQAKAGRSETTSVFDFELVPVKGGSDSFTLLFKGEPLANKPVTVINPDNWEKTFKTDEEGKFTVPVTDEGLYVLVARHEASADVEIAGKQVSTLQHIASVSFVAK